jgi:hypothetical protein
MDGGIKYFVEKFGFRADQKNLLPKPFYTPYPQKNPLNHLRLRGLKTLRVIRPKVFQAFLP